MGFTYDKSVLLKRAEDFCRDTSNSIAYVLGYGTQGVVFKSNNASAIKVHSLEAGYIRERDVYLRLMEREIQSVHGFAIPRLIRTDNERFLFEMSIVHVPCVLDFGGAYLDSGPPHAVRNAEWMDEKAKDFGENWEKAKSILRELEFRASIFIADVNSANIKFPVF